MSNRAVDNYAQRLEFVPDCYKTQKMYNKPIDIYDSAIQLTNIRLKKCAIKLLILVFLHLILSLINIRLKKYVIRLFSNILLC